MKTNKQREIVKFIENLVSVHEVTSIEHISDIDRNWLAALYMQAERDSDKFCCITDGEDSEETWSLLIRCLFTSDPSHQYDLIEALKKNAFQYYKNDIEELLNEAVESHESDTYGDYVRVRAQDNGEPLLWGKHL